MRFQSLSTDFLFTSVTGSSTSRCGYSSPSSIHFRRISTAFCAFFLHVLLYGGKSRCGVLCIADIVIACHADLLRHGYIFCRHRSGSLPVHTYRRGKQCRSRQSSLYQPVITCFSFSSSCQVPQTAVSGLLPHTPAWLSVHRHNADDRHRCLFRHRL